jgi:hypothetical protein
MTTEAQELHRIITASVRDMLDAYRIQAHAGPVSAQALEQIVFRAAHAVVHSLSPYPAAQRAAMLPNIVRVMLAAFLEDVAATPDEKGGA